MARAMPIVAEEALTRLDEGLTRVIDHNGIIRYSSGKDKRGPIANRIARIQRKVGGDGWRVALW